MGDVLRWYTRARRIPTLIGKLPGSERGLPFGPYTLTQGVGGSVAAIAAIQSEPWWARWGFWGDKIVIVAITLTAVFALRLVKPGGRDPVTAVFALAGVVSAGRHGSHRGRQIKARKPVQVHARTRVLTTRPSCAGAAAAVTHPRAEPITVFVPVVPTQAVRATPRPPTNLDRILAQLAQKSSLMDEGERGHDA